MMQNGRMIAVWMNNTVGVEILNQTTPRIAQPTEGKAVEEGQNAPFDDSSRIGAARTAEASASASDIAIATEATTRPKLTAAW